MAAFPHKPFGLAELRAVIERWRGAPAATTFGS
jgi:hypothetical protein